MIIYMKIENYRSIGEAIEINFLANSDKSHIENLINLNNTNLLSVISIYGGNATGKTNIIKAIKNIVEIISGVKSIEEAYDPCKFYPKTETNFEIFFIKNSIKHFYKLNYNKEKILEEKLYYYPKGKIAKIFDRKNSTFTFGNSFTLLENYKTISEKTNFLKTINEFLQGKIAEIEVVIKFFINEIVFMGLNDIEKDLKIAEEKYKKSYLEDNSNNTKKFLDYFYNNLNLGKIDIVYPARVSETINAALHNFLEENNNKSHTNNNSSKKEKELTHISFKISEDILKRFHSMLNITPKELEIVMKYRFKKKDIRISLHEESKGMQKIFSLGETIVDILENNKLLLFDELEVGFHTLLAKKVIELFLAKNNSAQLLFTTHDTSLLNLEIFRRDQIYFTCRSKETDYNTKLISLGEIPGIRKTTDIEKEYLEGKYCPLPEYSLIYGKSCEKND